MRKERGQASLEYILMLCTACLLCMILFNTFLKPALGRLVGFTSGKINQALSTGNLHTLPFKK